MLFSLVLVALLLSMAETQYNKPIIIPSDIKSHFSLMNVIDGTYKFGYDTGDGKHQSYREETRDSKGRVKGQYGFIGPDNVLRVVEYVADEKGYRPILTKRYLVQKIYPFIGPIPFKLPAFYEDNRIS